MCNVHVSTETNTCESVTKLMEPYADKGFCLIVDSSSLASTQMASELLKQKTTFMGPLKRVEKALPAAFCSQVKCYDAIFFERDESILTVYQSKPNEKLVLLSTEHDMANVPEYSNESLNDKKKPNTILTYEEKKSQKAKTNPSAMRSFSVQGSSRRWPLLFFHHLVNMCVHNAWILYKMTHGTVITKREFTLKLADEILDVPGSASGQEDIFMLKKELVDLSAAASEPAKKASKIQKACQIRRCNNNKAIVTCVKCERPCCGQCCAKKVIFCAKCV